jgi:uncharacterized membrane protein YkoI
VRKKLKALLITAGVIAAAAGGGAAIAGATGGDREDREDRGPDRAITGDALQRASDAALKEAGGGRVTETEAGDEDSYYEVEVTKADGTEVDVQLDRDFSVVGSETDRDDGD